ncbi:MAG: hypothetical protein F4X12_01885 [Acidobacteriia bacterium]|nr:hypothetical protein [Terriglobia bacterium]
MNRTLAVTVDQSTWPKQAGAPVFPASFQGGGSSVDLNIPQLLLLIGYLTTPSHAFGTSLSEFWAWVRYLNAVSDDSDLRLTRAFSDLDAHQKTILSDDFGMGVPIYWLAERFSLEPPVDGRYFMDRLAAAHGVIVADPPKYGPSKSPDFVALDTSGAWHVIECKGTQSGDAYRKRQLGSPGPPATGAVAQKSTISFPSGLVGQRLACGLALAVEGDAAASSLRVIDPPAEEGFVVEEEDLDVALDTLRTATASRVLRLAGFGSAASALSWLPSTLLIRDFPPNSRKQSRQGDLHTTIERAQEQLKSRDRYESFSDGDLTYVGRKIQFDLAVPASIQGPGIRSIRLRYGLTAKFLDAIGREFEADQQDAEPREAASGSTIPEWPEMLGAARLEADGARARMRVGPSFFGEIELLN